MIDDHFKNPWHGRKERRIFKINEWHMASIDHRYMLTHIGHLANKFGFVESGIQCVPLGENCLIILDQMDRSFQSFAISWLKTVISLSAYCKPSTLELILIHIFQRDYKISFSVIILSHVWSYTETFSLHSCLLKRLKYHLISFLGHRTR